MPGALRLSSTVPAPAGLPPGSMSVTSRASSAAPAAITKTSWYAWSVGAVLPPARKVMLASTAATVALQNAWPIERMRVFRPLAAPVSLTGTPRITRAGSAEYAMAVPEATTVAPAMMSHRLWLVKYRTPYPAAMIPAASARLTLGPCLAEIRAETGDSATMATPPGSRHRPLTTSEAPSP